MKYHSIYNIQFTVDVERLVWNCHALYTLFEKTVLIPVVLT
jgi:hypothetical protein